MLAVNLCKECVERVSLVLTVAPSCADFSDSVKLISEHNGRSVTLRAG
jgi:hypothetical protein